MVPGRAAIARHRRKKPRRQMLLGKRWYFERVTKREGAGDIEIGRMCPAGFWTIARRPVGVHNRCFRNSIVGLARHAGKRAKRLRAGVWGVFFGACPPASASWKGGQPRFTRNTCLTPRARGANG